MMTVANDAPGNLVEQWQDELKDNFDLTSRHIILRRTQAMLVHRWSRRLAFWVPSKRDLGLVIRTAKRQASQIIAK